jgi:hypothetical protein
MKPTAERLVEAWFDQDSSMFEACKEEPRAARSSQGNRPAVTAKSRFTANPESHTYQEE